MRAGKVVTIRINPKDCMSIIDVLGVTKQLIPGASFPALASLALSSLLETVRKNGAIPTRDGFEYNEMMAGFHGSRRDGKKLAIAETLHRAGSEIHVAPVGEPEYTTAHSPAEPEEVSADVMRARTRLKELLTKQDLAEDNPAVIWSAEDQLEYDTLFPIVYPHG